MSGRSRLLGLRSEISWLYRYTNIGGVEVASGVVVMVTARGLGPRSDLNGKAAVYSIVRKHGAVLLWASCIYILVLFIIYASRQNMKSNPKPSGEDS